MASSPVTSQMDSRTTAAKWNVPAAAGSPGRERAKKRDACTTTMTTRTSSPPPRASSVAHPLRPVSAHESRVRPMDAITRRGWAAMLRRASVKASPNGRRCMKRSRAAPVLRTNHKSRPSTDMATAGRMYGTKGRRGGYSARPTPMTSPCASRSMLRPTPRVRATAPPGSRSRSTSSPNWIGSLNMRTGLRLFSPAPACWTRKRRTVDTPSPVRTMRQRTARR